MKVFIRPALVAAMFLSSASVLEASDSCSAIYQVSQDLLEKNNGLNSKIISLESQFRSSGLDKAYYESKLSELQKSLDAKESQIDWLNSTRKHSEEQLELAKTTLKKLSISIAVLKNISLMEGDINSILADGSSPQDGMVKPVAIKVEQDLNNYQSLNTLVREKDSSLPQSNATQSVIEKPKKENDYASLLQDEIASPPNKVVLFTTERTMFSGKFIKGGFPIRVAPSVGARITGLSQFNQKVSVVERNGSWYRLSIGGWVHKSIVGKY